MDQACFDVIAATIRENRLAWTACYINTNAVASFFLLSRNLVSSSESANPFSTRSKDLEISYEYSRIRSVSVARTHTKRVLSIFSMGESGLVVYREYYCGTLGV